MTQKNISTSRLLESLQRLADDALHLWDLPAGARARLINVAENTTYLVEAPGGYRSVLRVHRDHYHSRRAIECELAWLDALAQSGGVETPGYFRGRDGSAVQSARGPGMQDPRHLVLFQFVDGATPDTRGDLTEGYETLGAIAARCHAHALSWDKPQPFERLTWDLEAVFGAAPTWGNWRDAPGVTKDLRSVLEHTEALIRTRLDAYGKAPGRFNLIHADMRLANLLVSDTGTRLIDFDDCGYGWLMYDFAAAISFIEDDPRVPELRSAWLRGYRSVRPLDAADEAEIGTFVMLRRMALLAWIGSHIDAPEPQALAPGFALSTARLAQSWLEDVK